MGDDGGAVTANPADARFFDFDFVIEGNNLGRVSISINDTGNLKIFFSQGITEDTDETTQDLWFDFLREMRFFAKRRLMRFDTRDITKSNLDKTDFQYLAQKQSNGTQEETMAESKMFGSSKTSKRKVGETLLIVRHDGKIDDSIPGSRSRKIKNIFIQNAEGERFKSPFAWLPLGRALQRHVYHGGMPHDDHGKDIIETAAKCLQLASFQKHVRNKTKSMNPDAMNISERTSAKLKSLRNHMECLSQQKYYEDWKEQFQPKSASPVVLDAATMESYKDTFTVRGFDEGLAEAFPLIHSIMQEEGEVDLEAYVGEAKEEDICPECKESPCECDDTEEIKEFAAFESWAHQIAEGVLTPDITNGLQDLLAQDLQLGASGELVQSLQGIGIDDETGAELFASLNQLAKMNPNADSDLIKHTIMSWLDQTDPQAAQQLAGAEAQPQQAQPLAQPAPPAEQPVAESTLSELADHALASEIRELSGKIKHLNDLYIQSKRVNDIESLQKIKQMMAMVAAKKAALMDKVNAQDADSDSAFLARVRGKQPEENEGAVGTALGGMAGGTAGEIGGAALGGAVGGPFGAAVGGIAGDVVGTIAGGKAGDTLTGEETDEEAPKKPTPQEIAKSIVGFFDRDKGTWTKGRPGIVAGIVREFGDEAGELAKNFIMKLSNEAMMAESKDPCWKNYKQIGTKKKGGKTVPNCVPKESFEESLFKDIIRLSGVKK